MEMGFLREVAASFLLADFYCHVLRVLGADIYASNADLLADHATELVGFEFHDACSSFIEIMQSFSCLSASS